MLLDVSSAFVFFAGPIRFASFRLNFDYFPTLLPELLQGPYLGPQLLLTDVEREWCFDRGLYTCHCTSSKPVRIYFMFNRVSTLTKLSIRVKVALRRENVRPWHEVEHDFLDSEYRGVRNRQMKELEQEDDLMNKIPVRYVLLSSSWKAL